MARVIPDAELLFNQMRHTRAGPQRRFVAQPLRTLLQKLDDPCPLLAAQQRLSPSPPAWTKAASPLSRYSLIQRLTVCRATISLRAASLWFRFSTVTSRTAARLRSVV